MHPALNVFSHSLDYALKLLSCNRTMEQSNKTVFFLVWELLLQWKRNTVVFTVGEILLVFIPNRKRF